MNLLLDLNLDFSNPKVAIVNVVIILFILLSLVEGYRKGFFESVIRFFGFIIACILAFAFKNKLSVLMYTYLPFFKFGGEIKGITAINILLYELIAFILIFIIVMLIINLLLKMTNAIEKVVKAIPLIGTVDRLLGALVAFVDSIVVLYFVIFLFKFGCNLFAFEIRPSLADNIMEISVLNDRFGNSISAFDDIVSLKKDYDSSQKDEFNNKAIKILLERKVITQENLDLLVKKNKISYNP